jgi:hydrogenase nickel incorporation protein HypA/HybF
MHELSIALSIVDMAAEEAQRREVRVCGVHLRLGPLSGVVKQALLSAYELAREGSPLADARLVIEEVPVLAHCPACRATRAVVSVQQLVCAECGTPTPEVVSGRELEMVALEVQ